MPKYPPLPSAARVPISWKESSRAGLSRSKFPGEWPTRGYGYDQSPSSWSRGAVPTPPAQHRIRVIRAKPQLVQRRDWKPESRRLVWVIFPAFCFINGTHSSIRAWKNPMDRETWQATVHGVAKSQTWLSDWAHPCKQAGLPAALLEKVGLELSLLPQLLKLAQSDLEI